MSRCSFKAFLNRSSDWRSMAAPGLSQPSHDDEQGANHSDEDQHSEPDPQPLLGCRLFPDHFGARSAFFSFAPCVRLLAAARDAFNALSLRCLICQAKSGGGGEAQMECSFATNRTLLSSARCTASLKFRICSRLRFMARRVRMVNCALFGWSVRLNTMRKLYAHTKRPNRSPGSSKTTGRIGDVRLHSQNFCSLCRGARRLSIVSAQDGSAPGR